MEAASLVFSVAQTLFAALQSKELKEICSWWGCESELKRLQNTVNTIKSVLLDAEAKQLLNYQELNYVEKLKAAVYDADDLLDEFTALVEQQQHLLNRGMVPKKVRILFSRFGKLKVFRKMSKTVKKIRKELDGIASDASQFSFKIDYEPIRRRREETCSYVHEKHVIGREKETEEIINMLLAPDSDNHVAQRDSSVLAIVGMGGLGKTTLAQHIYEHDKIKSEFQLRLWACVADQDPDQLLLQPILAKILESATGTKDDGSGIDLVQKQLRKQLQGKKYLLVLDDVWIENHNEWLKLETFLLGCGRGSRIMVTTRSERTAQAVGSVNSYKLQGLSQENSWHLFEKVAFDGREGHKDHHELVKIGKEIVKKCSNVPLSIRVVGGLLYGQEKKKWLQFQQRNLAKIVQGENNLMPVLKLSYHNLHPAMKSCFAYCALFPKDEVILKETLISLWMAQGYIEPLCDGQSIEDAGEDYFLILLRRCFFQDVEMDEFGEIVSCKMHDLMHDMAQIIAGNEICVVDSTTSILDEKVRHVRLASHNNVDDHFFNETKIRTCIKGMDSAIPIIQAIFTKWTRLRVLDFSFNMARIKGSFPDSISNLLHLRYIDLTDNQDLQRLPESVTQLPYLQTLILKGCGNLKELPKSFSKLVKLRFLDIDRCWQMSCMPSGMDKLTSLRRLTRFVVSEISGESNRGAGGLKELRALEDLRGRLTIEFESDFRYIKEERRKGRYLSNKKDLNAIVILLYDCILDRGVVEGQKELLEDLQPHENLKELELRGYKDVRMPRWAKTEKLETSLPNLVNICLSECHGLQELLSFSKLQHLKSLKLGFLSRLDHVESTTTSREKVSFFPSLEILQLYDMEELKGWWSESVHEWMPFPRLSELYIYECPNLQYIPGCPVLETLSLNRCNEKLRIMIADEKGKEAGCNSSNQGHGNGGSGSLRRVVTDNGRCLEQVRPISACHNLKEMVIQFDMEMESLSEVREEVLRNCSSSLQSLKLDYMHKLRNLSGLEHLTALESLELSELDRLSFDDNPEQEEGMPWRCLRGNLHSLKLSHLRGRVKNLPKGMQHLTSLRFLWIQNMALEALPEWIGCLSSLQSLYISSCEKIESLPRSMRQLTSLNHLYMANCSQRLYQRCQRQDGEDWPLIHHIRDINIYGHTRREGGRMDGSL